jgi:hypothetical protein
MQNKTYAELYALVLALSGNDSFTTAEQVKILGAANRRLYQAYRSAEIWPRYIIGAQARPATDSVISREYTAAAFTGSSAKRSGTTVTIVCTTAVTFVAGMSVTISGLSGTTDPNGTYVINGRYTTTIANDTFTYDLATGTSTETYTGTASSIAVALPDIDSFIRIWSANPLALSSAAEYEFYVDVDGAHVIDNSCGVTSFWVNGKKEWDGPYTTSSTTIPLEYFYWAAHATYSDYLRLDGQVDKALAEENVAQSYLVLELDRAENQRNTNRFHRIISTPVSRQSR